MLEIHLSLIFEPIFNLEINILLIETGVSAIEPRNATFYPEFKLINLREFIILMLPDFEVHILVYPFVSLAPRINCSIFKLILNT